MSRLVGTLSGAVVAGGVYYAFSNMIQSRTQRHIADLQALSEQLRAPPGGVAPGPLPAMERIERYPRKSYMQGRWNEEIHGLWRFVGGVEDSVAAWGRKWLYGGPRS